MVTYAIQTRSKTRASSVGAEVAARGAVGAVSGALMGGLGAKVFGKAAEAGGAEVAEKAASKGAQKAANAEAKTAEKSVADRAEPPKGKGMTGKAPEGREPPETEGPFPNAPDAEEGGKEMANQMAEAAKGINEHAHAKAGGAEAGTAVEHQTVGLVIQQAPFRRLRSPATCCPRRSSRHSPSRRSLASSRNAGASKPTGRDACVQASRPALSGWRGHAAKLVTDAFRIRMVEFLENVESLSPPRTWPRRRHHRCPGGPRRYG